MPTITTVYKTREEALSNNDFQSAIENIDKYVKENYISKFNTIIDRCYRQEMHVCRTSVSTYGDYVYSGFDETYVEDLISAFAH